MPTLSILRKEVEKLSLELNSTLNYIDNRITIMNTLSLSSEVQALWGASKTLINQMLSYLLERIQLFSLDSLQQLKIKLSTIINYLSRLKEKFLVLSDKEQVSNQISGIYELLLGDTEVRNLAYLTDEVLDSKNFKLVIEDIKLKIKEFDPKRNYATLYNKLDEDDKIKLSSRVLEIRNNIYNGKIGLTDENISKISNELDFLLNKEVVFESISNIIDSNNIATNFKENLSTILNSDFASEYKKLADNLDNEAAKLNYITIFLFTIICVIILLKLIFISLYNIQKFTLISATWLALIFSISAFITYLIRERKRINGLRDYYRIIQIELTALPKYIGEFNSNQRIEMLIKLSSNYFKGTTISINNDSPKDNSEISINPTLVEKMIDLSKNINDKK